MKKISLSVTFGFFFSLIAFGQKISVTKVPAIVKASFNSAYPGIAGKWEKEDGNYEVNFKKAGSTMSAIIQPNGSIIETETDIKITDLPAKAASYVQEHYPGKPVKEASKIINADRSVNYEARVSGKDVIFDINGKFIKEAKD